MASDAVFFCFLGFFCLQLISNNVIGHEKVIPCFKLGKISTTCLHPLNNVRNRRAIQISLQWPHNERDGVSNHMRLDCLLNRLFRHRSKKSSKLRVTDLCEGNSPVTMNSPHKGPETRKMFPFDDVIMKYSSSFPPRRYRTEWTLHPLASCPDCGIQSEITSLVVMKQNLHIRLYKRSSLYSVYSENYYTINRVTSWHVSCKGNPVLIQGPLFRVWVFNFKDDSVVRPCYLYNGNPYNGKTAIIYWDGQL